MPPYPNDGKERIIQFHLTNGDVVLSHKMSEPEMYRFREDLHKLLNDKVLIETGEYVIPIASINYIRTVVVGEEFAEKPSPPLRRIGE